VPKVLHVVAPDATLSGFGLEAWIDAGRGFLPVVASADPHLTRWDTFPVRTLPRATRGVGRLAVHLRPGADAWARWLLEQGIGLVHLHDLGPAEDLLRAADRLDLPVVASWPEDGPARFPFERLDHVLAPSPLRADRVRALAGGRVPVRVAPPPVLPPDNPRRALATRAPGPEGVPLRWVTTVADAERARLSLVVRAFGRHAATSGPTELMVVLGGCWLEEARLIVDAYAPGAPIKVVHVGDAAGLRAALAGAHLGVFPQGDSWGVWSAAAQGLPMVLGRAEAACEGFEDLRHAVLADEDALAARMAFLASRPYMWPALAEGAMRLAVGRLAFERACQIPFEVYREVLRTYTAPAAAIS
jgi:hypothetical protein